VLDYRYVSRVTRSHILVISNILEKSTSSNKGADKIMGEYGEGEEERRK
jgi:hypothetical protein